MTTTKFLGYLKIINAQTGVIYYLNIGVNFLIVVIIKHTLIS